MFIRGLVSELPTNQEVLYSGPLRRFSGLISTDFAKIGVDERFARPQPLSTSDHSIPVPWSTCRYRSPYGVASISDPDLEGIQADGTSRDFLAFGECLYFRPKSPGHIGLARPMALVS